MLAASVYVYSFTLYRSKCAFLRDSPVARPAFFSLLKRKIVPFSRSRDDEYQPHRALLVKNVLSTMMDPFLRRSVMKEFPADRLIATITSVSIFSSCEQKQNQNR